MSTSKTYTLTLTADELRNVDALQGRGLGPAAVDKLYQLAAQAKADREAEDLRLPWRTSHYGGSVKECGWSCLLSGQGGYELAATERAAKLMSAAPELLEAVREAEGGVSAGSRAARLIARALRKVETGTPE